MEIEIAVNIFLQNLGGWLVVPMQAVTFLGNGLLFFLIIAALYWSIDPVTGFRTGLILILSGSLNSSLKMLFHSPRPFWVDPRVKVLTTETTFGLPSGHSQNAAVVWGMIAACIRKKWAWITALLVIFLVGLSRLYLGVHFVRDVLSGWLIGGLLVILYLQFEKPVAKWLAARSLPLQLLMSLVFSLVLILVGLLSRTISSDFSLPQDWIDQAIAKGAAAPDPFSLEGTVTYAGLALGFTAGYAWWHRKFGHKVIKPASLKFLGQYAVGLAGMIGLYFGLKAVFPAEPESINEIFRYLRYALIGAWVSAFAPWLFRKLKLD